MNDAACEEIPAARRCSGCASSLVLKSTDGVQGTTPRRVIFCAGPHHEACPECVKAGRCAIAEAEGKDGVMGTLPEPVAWQYRRLYTGDDPGWGLWQPCTKDEADRLRGREDVQVRDLFTHGVRASRPLGCALAMRVMQSDLYQQLDGAERADCDELVQQNLEWFKRDRTAGVGMPREGQQ